MTDKNGDNLLVARYEDITKALLAERASERAAVIAEIESWLVDEHDADRMRTSYDSPELQTRNALRKELRAKLVEMKEGK